MNHEARILYLCGKAVSGALTLDEECELLGYAALEQEIWLLIELEKKLGFKTEVCLPLTTFLGSYRRSVRYKSGHYFDRVPSTDISCLDYGWHEPA
ncbi:MAG: hypothetical protein WD509_02025 [Candidatus Paceibacterota bacterium]